MTSFYSWRLIFMTFFGPARGDPHTHEHAHESPWSMLLPIAVLALGSVVAGMIWYGDFFGHHVDEFFGSSVFVGAENHVLEAAHHVPAWVKASAFVAMAAGLGIASLFYLLRPDLPARSGPCA